MHHFWPLEGIRFRGIQLDLELFQETVHGCFPPISDLLEILFPKKGSHAAGVHLKLGVIDQPSKFIRVHEIPSQSILALGVKCPA